MLPCSTTHSFFFFNDTATTEIYTLSLHDALPISITGRWADERPPRAARAVACECRRGAAVPRQLPGEPAGHPVLDRDRKSTRLNSSHGYISYAVFCLKKKNIEHANHLLLGDPRNP